MLIKVWFCMVYGTTVFTGSFQREAPLVVIDNIASKEECERVGSFTATARGSYYKCGYVTKVR